MEHHKKYQYVSYGSSRRKKGRKNQKVPLKLLWLKTFQIWVENQDGGVGRHTAPPRTTRTDRKSYSKEVPHQVDKKETYIQTSRRGGDGHRGGEDSRGCGGPRLAECGTNGAGSLTTSRPYDPTFAHR